MDDKGLPIFHTQHTGCWWVGNELQGKILWPKRISSGPSSYKYNANENVVSGQHQSRVLPKLKWKPRLPCTMRIDFRHIPDRDHNPDNDLMVGYGFSLHCFLPLFSFDKRYYGFLYSIIHCSLRDGSNFTLNGGQKYQKCSHYKAGLWKYRVELKIVSWW